MGKTFWQEDRKKVDWSNMDSYVETTTNDFSIRRFYKYCKNLKNEGKDYGAAYNNFLCRCVHKMLGDSTDQQWTGLKLELAMDIIGYYFPDFWQTKFFPDEKASRGSRQAKAYWRLKARLGLVSGNNMVERKQYEQALREYQDNYENIHKNWIGLVCVSQKRVAKIKANESAALEQFENSVSR